MAYHFTHLGYDVIHWALGGSYSLFLALCIIFFLQRFQYSCAISATLVFYTSYLLGLTGRVLFFVFAPFIYEGWSFPEVLNQFLNTIPSFFFFTAFLIIVTMWAEMYHFPSSEPLRIDKLRTLIAIIVVLMWAISIVFWSMIVQEIGWDKTQQVSIPVSSVQKFLFCWIVIFDVLLSTGFAVYGLLLLRQISQLLSSRQRTVLMFRIGAITGLCGLIFLVRSGITVWAVFFSATYIKLWWFDGFYYWAFELLPLSLMLVILRGGDVRRRSNAMQYQPETEPILPNNKSHANYSASYHSDTSAVSPIKSNIYYPDAN